MQNLDDPVNQKVRARIRDIRQGKKLSIRKAALLSEIPESSYSCMENGFYRISLLNLKKILDGLGVSIDDVWPDSKGAAALQRPRLAKPVDPSVQRFFRVREVFQLSQAKRAVLLEGRESLDVVFSVNLTEREKSLFCRYFPDGLHASWSVYEKESNGYRCCLCLQDAVIEDYLQRLVNIYLDLWLAESLAQSRL